MSNNQEIEAIEKEFEEIEKKNAWGALYKKIQTEGAYDLSCSVAKSASNRVLNRYRDVLPYDHSRIIIKESKNDYINASLVEVEDIGRKYILSQGPLSQTTPQFWLMIWQQNSKGIVMLNKIIEKNQLKCHQYWPLGENRGGENVLSFNSVNLTVELIKEVNHSHYIYRTFKLINTLTEESREILHFHYTTWPDFGVPQSPEAFFEFLKVVGSSQVLGPESGPVVIHCSAGIGRSGTFCLVDSILKMLADGLCTSECSKILDVLLGLRKYRMGLIQTADQLRFSYQAIAYGARRLDQTNAKDPTEESSSEEISQEEPPPCPPPRSASLGGRVSVDSDKDEATDTEEDIEDETLTVNHDPLGLNDDAFEKPLPEVPTATPSPELSPCPVISNCINDHSETDVKRRRVERIATTAAKLKDIKEKTKAAEDWQDTKDLLFGPLPVCALLVAVGGGVFYYMNHF